MQKRPPTSDEATLIAALLRALREPDAAAREAAVAPLVHRSLLRAGQLERNVRDYAFKKASDNAALYDDPPRLTEAHVGTVSTVGFADTAERGRRDKVFVAPSPGRTGMPAPVHVFYPESGGAISVLDFGSL
jgi:hypothetical protein